MERNRSQLLMLNVVCLLLVGLTLFTSNAYAQTNAGITYQGRILKPDGSPLQGATVQFRLQIRTPGTQNCLMFEEVQTQDMRNSNGNFALTINDGNGARTDTTGFGLDRVFANRLAYTFDPATCSTGSTYNPNADDGRKLVVFFKDETMSVWEPMPAQNINFVPYAMEAKQIAGFGINDLLRFDLPASALKNTSPLNEAQYDKLISLIAGTSTDYERAGRLGGAVLPAFGAGQAGRVLGWNGTAWEATDTVPTDSISTGKIQDNAVTSDKIANGTIAGADLAANIAINTTGAIATSGTISTSGTITSNVSTARDFRIYDQDVTPNENYISFRAPVSLPANYVFTWPSGYGTANQVLTTDGLGGLTWAAPAAATQWSNGAAGAIYYNGGSVGIGTATPSGKLDILANANGSAGNVNIRNTNAGDNAAAVLTLTNDNGGAQMSIQSNSSGFSGISGANRNVINAKTGGLDLAASNTSSGSTIRFFTNGSASTDERMRIASSGNVGIGTVAPASPLHVEKNQNAATIMRVDNTDTGAAAVAELDFHADGNYSSLKTFSTAGGGATQLEALSPALILKNNSATGYFQIQTNGSNPRLTVDATGNVGIGTVTPSLPLHVVGSSRFAGTTQVYNGASLVLSDSGVDRTTTMTHTNDAEFRITTSSGGISLMPGTAGVGVGVLSPTAALHLKAGTAASGTAPLKISSGPTMTTPEAGAIEFDGTSLFYTDNTNTRRTLGVAGAGITALTGDVTASGSGSAAATVAQVGGVTAANVAAGATLAYNATSAGTADAIVRRDSSGRFVAGGATFTSSMILKNGAGGNEVTLAAPMVGFTNYTLTMPTSAGTNGHLLTTNGSGALSWTDPASLTGPWGVTSGNAHRATGNVGIGTTAPSQKLHVVDSGLGGGGLLIENTTDGTVASPSLLFKTSAGQMSSLSQISPTSPDLGTGLANTFLMRAPLAAGIGIAATDTTGKIRFYTGGSAASNERARFDSAGNFGVGTTTPAARLDIAGSVKIGDGGEACVAGINGALRFSSSKIQFCVGTTWTDLASGGSGATNIDGLSDAIASAANQTVYLGANAGAASTTGQYNTAVGYGAAQFLTTGSYNIALGRDAGVGLSNQQNNILIGSDAGYALKSGTAGSYNVAIGRSAMFNNSGNTGGAYNVAVGMDAMKNGGTGSNNVAVGAGAGTDTSGVDSVFVGSGAGAGNLSDNSVVIGKNAGWGNTAAGGNNVLIGKEVFFTNGGANTGANNTLVGAFSAASNQAHTGSNNVTLGAYTLNAVTSGGSNTILGYNSGNTITSGGSNILIGTNIQTPAATTSNYLSIGNLIYGNTSSSRVGIGTATPGYALDVNGEVNATNVRVNGVAVSTSSGPWNKVISDINYTDGYVGIGTTTPSAPLHVAGNALIDNTFGAGLNPNAAAPANSLGFKIGASTSNPQTMYLENTSSAASAYGAYISRTGAATTGTGLYVNSAGATTNYSAIFMGGNLGVGTAAPDARVDINGTDQGALHVTRNNPNSLPNYVAYFKNMNYSGPGANTMGSQINFGVESTTEGVDHSLGSLRYRATSNAVGAQDSDIYLINYAAGVAQFPFVIKSSGNVGVGVSSPAYKVDVNGAVNATQLCIAGTCQSSWPAAGGGQWTTSSNDIYSANSGNVGIGTTTPSNKLEVNGNAKVMGSQTGAVQVILENNHATSKKSEVAFKRTDLANSTGWYLGTDMTSNGSDNFYVWGGNTSPTYRFMIDGSGNVGIGKTNPGTRLDVNGGIRASSESIFSINGYADLAMGIEAPFKTHMGAGGNHGAGFVAGISGAQAANTSAYGAYIANNASVSGTGKNYGVYVTGTDNYFSGNVGIGTTTPSRKLTVAQTGTGGLYPMAIEAAPGTGPGSYMNLAINNKSSGAYKSSVEFQQNGASKFSFGVDYQGNGTNDFSLFDNVAGAHRFFITSAGNIGVGTTSPTLGTLEIRKSGLPWGAYIASGPSVGGVAIGGTASGGVLQAYTSAGGDANLLLQANGVSYVGVGTSNPTERLHVNGNVIADSYLYTSDRRLKKDITPIQSALDKVLQMNGVAYRWIKPASKEADRDQIGLIAQDVELVFPEAVTISKDGYKRVNYPMLVAPLIESVKELHAADEKQQRSIASLEARAEKAEKKVVELEKKLEAKNAEFEARLRALEKSLRPAR